MSIFGDIAKVASSTVADTFPPDLHSALNAALEAGSEDEARNVLQAHGVFDQIRSLAEQLSNAAENSLASQLAHDSAEAGSSNNDPASSPEASVAAPETAPASAEAPPPSETAPVSAEAAAPQDPPTSVGPDAGSMLGGAVASSTAANEIAPPIAETPSAETPSAAGVIAGATRILETEQATVAPTAETPVQAETGSAGNAFSQISETLRDAVDRIEPAAAGGDIGNAVADSAAAASATVVEPAAQTETGSPEPVQPTEGAPLEPATGGAPLSQIGETVREAIDRVEALPAGEEVGRTVGEAAPASGVSSEAASGAAEVPSASDVVAGATRLLEAEQAQPAAPAETGAGGILGQIGDTARDIADRIEPALAASVADDGTPGGDAAANAAPAPSTTTDPASPQDASSVAATGAQIDAQMDSAMELWRSDSQEDQARGQAMMNDAGQLMDSVIQSVQAQGDTARAAIEPAADAQAATEPEPAAATAPTAEPQPATADVADPSSGLGGLDAAAAAALPSAAADEQAQAQTISEQMRADEAAQEAARQQLLQETQARILEVQQDVTSDQRTPTEAGAQQRWEDYIRSDAGQPAEAPVVAAVTSPEVEAQASGQAATTSEPPTPAPDSSNLASAMDRSQDELLRSANELAQGQGDPAAVQAQIEQQQQQLDMLNRAQEQLHDVQQDVIGNIGGGAGPNSGGEGAGAASGGGEATVQPAPDTAPEAVTEPAASAAATYEAAAATGAQIDAQTDGAMELLRSDSQADQARGQAMMNDASERMSAVTESIQAQGDAARAAIESAPSDAGAPDAAATTAASAGTEASATTTDWQGRFEETASQAAELDARENEALDLMRSPDPADQLRGQELMQQNTEQFEGLSREIQAEGNASEAVIENLRGDAGSPDAALVASADAGAASSAAPVVVEGAPDADVVQASADQGAVTAESDAEPANPNSGLQVSLASNSSTSASAAASSSSATAAAASTTSAAAASTSTASAMAATTTDDRELHGASPAQIEQNQVAAASPAPGTSDTPTTATELVADAVTPDPPAQEETPTTADTPTADPATPETPAEPAVTPTAEPDAVTPVDATPDTAIPTTADNTADVTPDPTPADTHVDAAPVVADTHVDSTPAPADTADATA